MPTKVKIKIKDNIDLRMQLDSEYEKSSQIRMCRYGLLLAMHIMEIAEYKDMNNPFIIEGLFINTEWQKGNVRMHDVRQAGFQIHKLAKECDDIVEKTTLRVVGQAVATGHMKEHAMVASDYAIKVVNLLFPDDMTAVEKERIWQINQLKEIND